MKSSSYCIVDNSVAGRPKTREEEEIFGVREWENVHCKHCQACLRIFKYAPQGGAWCGRCGGFVCDTKKCATVCVPFQKKIDDFVQRSNIYDKIVQQYGLEPSHYALGKPSQETRRAWEETVKRLRVTG